MIPGSLALGLSPNLFEPMASEQPPRKTSTSMTRVLLLVGVAIVIFMAFTAYSVHKELQGRAQLAAIKDMYFPLLQQLDANIVRLDKIQQLYIQVVITGDRDSITKASQLGKEADQTFAEIPAIYPGHDQAITQLRSDLSTYQDLATKTSIAYLSQDRAAAGPMAVSMNRALAEIEGRVKAFRESGYDGFVKTLAGSQRDADTRLIMGLALGLMNLGFMTVLVYFIRNNLNMMKVIAVQNTTLEQRVAERTTQLSQKTGDINAMLQNMKMGVSTVIPGNTIHPEHSKYLCTIFAIEELAGKSVMAGLFGSSNLGDDAKAQIDSALAAILGEDAMMFALNGHLLPQEMRLSDGMGGHKTVQMDWNPIVSEDGLVHKVLFIVQDVTHLRELEASAARHSDELNIISIIVKVSVGKFHDFIASARNFIAENRGLIQQTKHRDPEIIAALFRNMHTLKGNARMYEFTHITDAAHRSEQTYDRLRKSAEEPWDSDAMLAELDQVDAAIARYVEVNEETLGRKGRAGDLLTTRGAFVSNDQLALLRSQTGALVASKPGADVARLHDMINQLGLIDLPRIVSGAVDSISTLAKELDKPTPAVEVVGVDISFTSQFAEALKSAYMHIVRNSLDHGIEAPAERLRAGKLARGKLLVACERSDGQVRLHISDDGRGLALHRLREVGLAGNIYGSGEVPTRQAVAEIIFCSGLSTAASVTQISGRGVGMDAVRTFLKAQGASIRVVLQEPAGTQMDFAPFEFVIDIPPAAYSH